MNIKLFREVVDYIKDHPEEWDQAHWCGSSCCIAGHTIRMFGTEEERKLTHESTIQAIPYNQIEKVCTMVQARATELLDLNRYQQVWLFHSGRTIRDFEAVEREGTVTEDMIFGDEGEEDEV